MGWREILGLEEDVKPPIRTSILDLIGPKPLTEPLTPLTEPLTSLTCKGCGKKFRPDDIRRLYCSEECRNRTNVRAFRARRKMAQTRKEKSRVGSGIYHPPLQHD